MSEYIQSPTDYFIVYGIIFLLLLYLIIKRATTLYILTATRIIVKSGILVRTRTEMELYRIKDYQAIQPFFLIPFGVHHLVLYSSDYTHSRKVFRGVRYGEQRLEEIRGIVEKLRVEKGVREFD